MSAKKVRVRYYFYYLTNSTTATRTIGLFVALLLSVIDIPNISGFTTARKFIFTTKLTMSSSEATTPLSNSDHILFDMPVSNNGARLRVILYYKQLSSEQVEIISPMKLGGLKSEEFMALSPQGLMPALTIQKEHASGMKHLSESPIGRVRSVHSRRISK